MDLNVQFEHREGKIFAIFNEKEIDVTNKVMPIVDDFLDYNLGLDIYGKVSSEEFEKELERRNQNGNGNPALG